MRKSRQLAAPGPYSVMRNFCVLDAQERSFARTGRPQKGKPSMTNQTHFNATHGLSDHPLYRTWEGIRRRCYNPQLFAYQFYGGRGIRMFEPWRDGPTQFIEWIEANLGQRPDRHSLDRIDNDGDYAPGNLRWATWSEQRQNQSARKDTERRIHDLPTGVMPSGKKFRAYRYSPRRPRYLGTFDTPEQAGDTVQLAKQERYFTHVPFGAREMLKGAA